MMATGAREVFPFSDNIRALGISRACC